MPSFQRQLVRRTIARGKILNWSPETFLAANIEELLSRVVQAGSQAFEGSSCGLFLLVGDTVNLAASTGALPKPSELTPMKLGEGFVGKAIKRGEPLLTNLEVLLGDKTSPRAPLSDSLLAIPMAFQGNALGLIAFTRSLPAFTLDDLEHAMIFAGQASLAITTQRVLDDRMLEIEKQQAALAQSERRYRLMAENAADVVFTADRELTLTYISPSVRALTGWEPHELVGKYMGDQLKPAALKHVRSAFWGQIGADKLEDVHGVVVPKLDLEVVARDGRTVITEVSLSIIPGDSGAFGTILGVARDVTARRGLEAQLRQAQKMEAVGRLAGGVAHEINNPLGVILGFAQGLARRIQPGDPIELPLRSIEREALRCKNLVSRLLTFSRKSTGSRSAVHPARLLESVRDLLQHQAKLHAVELVMECSEDAPAVLADGTLLQQILVNFATNAFDAMPQGGCLSMKAARSTNNCLRLEVMDTGFGMSTEVLDHIFDPFFTTKEPGKGTGLGLSLAYEIVQQHGGTIECRSKLGQGTTFVVNLPVICGQPKE